jgi:hypothetical protein
MRDFDELTVSLHLMLDMRDRFRKRVAQTKPGASEMYETFDSPHAQWQACLAATEVTIALIKEKLRNEID